MTFALSAAVALVAGCASSPEKKVERGLTASGECKNPWRIGNFGFATVNQVTQAVNKAMETEGAKVCAKVTLEDGGFDSQKQLRQLQDALTSKKYDAWAIGPIDGSLIQGVVKQALEQGIKVSSYEFPIGPNQLDWTSDQTPGMTITVGEPLEPQVNEVANQIKKACAMRTVPCGVIDFYGQRATSPFDAYRYEQLHKVLKNEKDIKILQSLNGNYSPADSRAAIKDSISRFGDQIDVIACFGDQMCFGSQQAYDQAGTKPGTNAYPALISTGGSDQGIAGVKDGKWFATITQPNTEQGRIQAEALVADLEGKKINYPRPIYAMQSGVLPWGDSYDAEDAKKYPDAKGQWNAG